MQLPLARAHAVAGAHAQGRHSGGAVCGGHSGAPGPHPGAGSPRPAPPLAPPPRTAVAPRRAWLCPAPATRRRHGGLRDDTKLLEQAACASRGFSYLGMHLAARIIHAWHPGHPGPHYRHELRALTHPSERQEAAARSADEGSAALHAPKLIVKS